jgi:hypothetical protein
MDARMRVNRATQRSYGVACESSNTLEHRDASRRDKLRAELIEATVQAVAEGGDPRLGSSRALL